MQQNHVPLIQSRFFLRTWRYDLACFLIPYFLLATLLLSGSFALTYRSHTAQIQETVSTTQQEIHGALSNASAIGYNLIYQPAIIPPLLPDNAEMRQQLVRILANYRAINSLYSEVLVYFPQLPTSLYSAHGALSIDTLGLFLPPDPDMNPYSTQLDAITSPVLLPASQQEARYNLSGLNSRDILYIVPMQRNMGRPYLTLLLLLDRARIDQLVQQSLDAFGGRFILRSAGERTIYASGNEQLPDDWDFSVLPSDAPQVLSSAGESYLLFSATDAQVPAHCFYVLPSRTLHLSVWGELRALCIAIGVIGILGLMLSSLLAYCSYLPIARLNRSLRQTGLQLPARSDELGDITLQVQTILSEKQEIGRRMDRVTDVVQTHMLRMVLDGQLTAENPLLHTAQLNLPGPQFVALCAALPCVQDDSAQTDWMHDLCQDIAWHTGSVYAIAQPDCIALLASLPGGLGTRTHQEHLVGALRAALAAYDLEAPIGVGNACTSLFGLSQSYRQARCILEQAEELSPTVVYFEDIQALGDTAPATLQTHQAQACRAIEKANEQVALQALHACLDDLSACARPVERDLQRLRLLDTLGNVFVQVGLWQSGEADAQWDLLLRNATSVQTRAVLESLVHTASLMATQENDPQGVEMLCTLQDYLAAHAFDPLLNLGQVVDAFGQSASIISRLCKKHFGMTFVDYISYLRMQKARALLSRTDLKLKEIVEQIGYSDVANFIRKFRLLEGMTPGEWRKVHAEEK